MTEINRRGYLIAAGAVTAGVAGLAGCAGTSEPSGEDDGDATGLLSTAVTDQPGDIADFESCVVTIDGIWVKPVQSEATDADADEEVTVDTPGNAPLQFKLAFEIREGERTTFTGDFTPVKRGRTDRYLLQPVADNLSVSYETVEEDTQSITQ